MLFHLPLRQTDGFVASLLRLMGLDLNAPDHTTLSRRNRDVLVPALSRDDDGPIHLIVDSTGWRDARGARTPQQRSIDLAQQVREHVRVVDRVLGERLRYDVAVIVHAEVQLPPAAALMRLPVLARTPLAGAVHLQPAWGRVPPIAETRPPSLQRPRGRLERLDTDSDVAYLPRSVFRASIACARPTLRQCREGDAVDLAGDTGASVSEHRWRLAKDSSSGSVRSLDVADGVGVEWNGEPFLGRRVLLDR